MQIDIVDGSWRYRVTYGTPALTGEFLQRLREASMPLRQLVLFDHFKFEQVTPGGLVYDYKIWLKDGRLWNQQIGFVGESDLDPSMTFSVAIGWRLSEFMSHRIWRDLMIELRNCLAVTLVRLDPV